MSVSLGQVLAATVPGGSRVKGRAYFLDGAVTRIEGSAWEATAIVRGSRDYHVTLRREGHAFFGTCECPYFDDRFVVCKHIWAAVLAADQRRLLTGNGDVPREAVLLARDADEIEGEGDPE